MHDCPIYLSSKVVFLDLNTWNCLHFFIEHIHANCLKYVCWFKTRRIIWRDIQFSPNCAGVWILTGVRIVDLAFICLYFTCLIWPGCFMGACDQNPQPHILFGHFTTQIPLHQGFCPVINGVA